jgi:hypothetical protein
VSPVGTGDVMSLVVRPAAMGAMRARKTKQRNDQLAKRQLIAFIAVAVATTVVAHVLNEFIERRLAPDDADLD